MRLIDADALEANGWMMQRTVRVDSQTMEWQQKKPTDFPAELYVTLEMYDSLDDYCKRLRRALADAVPAEHGKWDCSAGLPTCTACGKMPREFYIDGAEKWPFCPMCGARMEAWNGDE